MKPSKHQLVIATAAVHRQLEIVCWALCVGMILSLSTARECRSQEEPLPRLELAPPSAPDQDGDSAPRRLPLECEPLSQDAPLSLATVDISPRDLDGRLLSESDLPPDCNKYLDAPIMYSALETLAPSHPCLLRSWVSAQFCHRPLYFEERALERCGVSHGCWQTPKSAARFFGGVLLLPSKMWCLPPCVCVSTPACL